MLVMLVMFTPMSALRDSVLTSVRQYSEAARNKGSAVGPPELNLSFRLYYGYVMPSLSLSSFSVEYNTEEDSSCRYED